MRLRWPAYFVRDDDDEIIGIWFRWPIWRSIYSQSRGYWKARIGSLPVSDFSTIMLSAMERESPISTQWTETQGPIVHQWVEDSVRSER